MDSSTKTFLNSLTNNNNDEMVKKILGIYSGYEKYNVEPITIAVINDIFDKINTTFYNNEFFDFLVTPTAVKRPEINFVDSGKSCADSDAMLEATEYEKGDSEFATFDFGFVVALTCLNSIESTEKIYYSGGYITKSRIIFIILMLLHESLHIIEYKDRYITKAKSEHTVFFYKQAFKLFGIISRMSEMFDSPDSLIFDDTERVNDISKRLTRRSALQDGADILNDYSHYEDDDGNTELIGYIVHHMFGPADSIKFIENVTPSEKSDSSAGGKKNARKKTSKRRVKNEKRTRRGMM